jgi:signal transduction histidine kinase/putative methionine-R-sulfoxide reductase with GAF domain
MDTARRGSPLSLREAQRRDALAAIAAAVARSRDLHTVLSEALFAIVHALEFDVAGIYLLDDDTGELRATSHHHGVAPEWRDSLSRLSRSQQPLAAALSGETPLVARDLSGAPVLQELARAQDLRAVVLVPLYAQGRTLGLMTLGGQAAREFAAEDLALLEAVGGMLGGAIDNARMLRNTQRHLDQVQALWEIDRMIAQNRDLVEVLDTVAREAAKMAGGDALIALVEHDEGVRVAAAHGDRALRVTDSRPVLAGTPLEELLRVQEPSAVRLPGEGEGPLRALVVPFRAAGRTLGALVALKPDRAGRRDELQILATFGHGAAMAVEKVRAREAEGRRIGQLALVSAASEIAASSLDLDVLVAAIARYIQTSFGYYSVAVYLVEREVRQAYLAGAAGAAAIMPKGDRVAFGEGIVGWVAEHGEHILANDVRREPRFVPAKVAATRAALAVPVRLAGEVVAIINVESDSLGAFDSGDLMAVEGIASQVASSVRNARLFEEKVRALRNLEILQEITNVLNTDLDLDALLERIARRSVEAVRPAQMGAVLLAEEPGLIVRSSHGYARPEVLARVRLELHEGLPGEVFIGGQGRLVSCQPGHYGSYADDFREAAGGTIRASALCVPIALPERKLGVLLLESATSPETSFDAEDLRFAATVADQAAIAIGNALRLRRIVEMDRQRQDYVSNVSHELRTPLTVIQGYIEALATGTAGAQADNFLRVSLDQCHRLARMIDDILEVSRLEQGTGRRPLQRRPVDLAAAVRQVVEGLRREAERKGIALMADVDPGLPAIEGDEHLLRSLLQNLVENALKFTSRGGHVTVQLHAEGGELVLRVRDDGIGIPREYHDRIFEKFFMVDGGRTRARPGAGIGLYLVREAAALHGGRLRVDSRPGEGSCFEARLPL